MKHKYNKNLKKSPKNSKLKINPKETKAIKKSIQKYKKAQEQQI